MAYNALIDEQLELIDIIKESYTKLQEGGTTRARVLMRKRALEDHFETFRANHAQLWAMKYKLKSDQRATLQELPYFKDKMYLLTEQIFLDNSTKMTELLDDPAPSIQQQLNATLHPANQPSAIKLPKMVVEVFDGNPEHWLKFKEMFVIAVGANTALSPVEKLCYLKSFVTGNAELQLRNLGLAGDNFQTAWDGLVAYYDNKRGLVNSALDILVNGKPLVKDSVSSIEELYAQVTQSLGALEALGRPVDTWDDIVVYLVSQKFDRDTMQEWERTLGASTTPPIWSQLKDFIFSRIRVLRACQRYQISCEPQSNSARSRSSVARSHVASAQRSSQYCPLCTEEHYLDKCPQYQALSVQRRIEKIRQLKCCFNCL